MPATIDVADADIERSLARAVVTVPTRPVAPRPPVTSFWRRTSHLWLLLLITLFGGALRFTRIGQPPLWADEAHTYSRVCGTYQQLIDILQYNGFVPLHYELYWWIKQGLPVRFTIGQAPTQRTGYPEERPPLFSFFSRRDANAANAPPTKRDLQPRAPLVVGGVTMTPLVMRLVPALAGTLMAPAIYFLARQMSIRRDVALVAALFAACSAYLLVYSRDAKMYMHFWLMCTLSVACLLWWLRAGTRLAWLCWVAASVAMCGLHATGAAVLVLELIMFVAAAPMWWTRGWRIMIRPLYFVLGVLVIASGPFGYYKFFNQYSQRVAKGGWDNTGIEWVDWYNNGRSGPELVRFTASAFLMSWEWPPTPQAVQDNVVTWNSRLPGHGYRTMPLRRLRLLEAAVCAMLGVLALGLLPWRRLRASHHNDAPVRALPFDRATSPPPRLLWLLAWLVLPAYGFYCASIQHFVAPHTWLATAADAIAAGSASAAANRPWPHYIGPKLVVLLLVLAAACGLAGLFVLSGWTWRQRLRNTLRTVTPVVAAFALCELTYLGFHAFLGGTDEAHSVWMPRYLGFCWPAVAIAVAMLLMRLPTRPLRVAAVALFIAINLAQYSARVFGHSEPPSDVLARDTVTAEAGGTTTRTYTRLTDNFGFAPGQGVMFTPGWRYYMVLFTGLQTAPMNLRLHYGLVDRNFRTWTGTAPLTIVRDLRHSPEIDHVIVWDRLDLRAAASINDDALLPQFTNNLGGHWRRVSEQLYPARDHWVWQDLFTCRRREYVRTSPPTTAPASTTQNQ